MDKKIVSRDQEIVFTNWTDEDFEGVWDKKTYKFSQGKSYYLPFYLAEHFAKHLADREYNKVFNSRLQEMKNKVGDQFDRKTLEHRVLNTIDVRNMSIQDFIDKCVTVLPSQEEIGVVRPKEVPMKEAILHRDENAQKIKEKYGDYLGAQVNERALNQNEEFEGEQK